MNRQSNPQASRSSILTDLIEELEEINNQLDDIGIGFDTGEIDYAGFERVMLQLRDCQGQLEEVLGEAHGSIKFG